MIIHMLQGFNFVETSCGKGIWTVFSAANYQDHANRGAVLVFSDPVDRPKPLVFDSVDVASSIEEVTGKTPLPIVTVIDYFLWTWIIVTMNMHNL